MEQLHPVAFHKGTARASEHLLACSGFSSGRKAGRKLGKALHTAAAISPMASKEMQQSQGAANHQPPSATRSCLCLGYQLLWAQTPKPLTRNFHHQGQLCGSGKHQVLGLELELTKSILWKFRVKQSRPFLHQTLCALLHESGG